MAHDKLCVGTCIENDHPRVSESVSQLSCGDAAAGLKWVPWTSALSFGIEALLLLPVNDQGGAGTETQALMTARLARTMLHLNAGGTLDTRGAEIEKGWRVSALVEQSLDGWRPGLEVFTRRFEGGELEALTYVLALEWASLRQRPIWY